MNTTSDNESGILSVDAVADPAVKKKSRRKPNPGEVPPVDESVLPPARKRAVRKTAAVSAIDEVERHRMIELAAYFIAERHGFTRNSAFDDWIQAEREIDAQIAA